MEDEEEIDYSTFRFRVQQDNAGGCNNVWNLKGKIWKRSTSQNKKVFREWRVLRHKYIFVSVLFLALA